MVRSSQYIIKTNSKEFKAYLDECKSLLMRLDAFQASLGAPEVGALLDPQESKAEIYPQVQVSLEKLWKLLEYYDGLFYYQEQTQDYFHNYNESKLIFEKFLELLRRLDALQSKISQQKNMITGTTQMVWQQGVLAVQALLTNARADLSACRIRVGEETKWRSQITIKAELLSAAFATATLFLSNPFEKQHSHDLICSAEAMRNVDFVLFREKNRFWLGLVGALLCLGSVAAVIAIAHSAILIPLLALCLSTILMATAMLGTVFMFGAAVGNTEEDIAEENGWDKLAGAMLEVSHSSARFFPELPQKQRPLSGGRPAHDVAEPTLAPVI